MWFLFIVLFIVIYYEIKSLFYNFYLFIYWKFYYSVYYVECNMGKVLVNLRLFIYNWFFIVREGFKLIIIIVMDILIFIWFVKFWYVCYYMLFKLWVLYKFGDFEIFERINYGILIFFLCFIYLLVWFFFILLVKWLNLLLNNM